MRKGLFITRQQLALKRIEMDWMGLSRLLPGVDDFIILPDPDLRPTLVDQVLDKGLPGVLGLEFADPSRIP
jgi:hypothetical protein